MATVGRPRSFDRDDALKKAMYVFWEKGYEGTTMADLIQSIGMKAPSIYAAFGNKDTIFREAVQAYLPIVLKGQLAALNRSAAIDEAVQTSLQECVSLFSAQDNPHTCLIMTAAINVAPEHAEHVASLKALREEYKAVWQKRFEKAKSDQQLLGEVNASELAEYFTTLIQGMALKAKDGASEDVLSGVAKLGLQTLLPLIKH